MSTFLRVALCSPTPSGDENLPRTSSNPAWCLSSAFSEPSAYEAFDALFRPTINLLPGARPPIRLWKEEIDPDDDDDIEHFGFNCKSTQFDSVDASYTLQDLHDVISSTALNGSDLDSQRANRQSDFEMVCFTSHVSLVIFSTYGEISSVWHGHSIRFSCLISSIRLPPSFRRAPHPYKQNWASFLLWPIYIAISTARCYRARR
jgi:hypothetical protein